MDNGIIEARFWLIMARIVQKFGGTSVADINRIQSAARKVEAEIHAGHQVAVVVSAMAGITNQLVEHCCNINPMHDAREYDAVVASGEQVTAGLMALALQELGIPARSWLGWQLPVLTDEMHAKARIVKIDTTEIERRMETGEVPVLAGFQGLSPLGAHYHAGTRRLGYLGRGAGRRAGSRPL